MSFRTNGLRIAVAAKSLSYLGDTVATIALTLRLAPSGTVVVAGLLAANLLPIVVLSGVAGRLVDAVDERLLLGVAGGVQAALCVVLARADGTATILAALAVLGAGQAVTSATWQAVIPALAAPGRLAWALSRAQVGLSLAAIAGPALGGALVATSGTRLPLLVDAGTFVSLAVCGVAIGRVRAAADPRRSRTGGAAIVRRSPVLRATVGLLFGALLVGSMVNVVEVFLVRSALHAGAGVFGAAGAAYAAGALLGALWAGRVSTRVAQARTLVRSVVAIGVGLALMGLAPDVASFVAASTLAGAANGVLNVSSAALILGATEPDQRGRVAAVVGGAVAAAQFTAYAAGAALGSVLDPRAVFVLGGALAAASTVGSGRRLRAAAGPEASGPRPPRRTRPGPDAVGAKIGPPTRAERDLTRALRELTGRPLIR